MRRKEREIKGREAVEAVLRRAKVLHLGLVDGDQAYVVPVSFGFEPGRLYFHSGRGGRKLELLAANPKVSFSAEAFVEILPALTACDFSVRYESVMGTGLARRLDDPAEKARGLHAVMAQYSRGVYEFEPRMVEATVVVAIDIEHMTGKRANMDG